MEINCVIKHIRPEQQVTPSFKKRELVIQTFEQYPQNILIEFHQDKCDLLNQFMEGETVNVGINLRGREWVSPQGETKYFNTITGWKIFRKTDTDSSAPTQPKSAVDNYMSNQNKSTNNHAQAEAFDVYGGTSSLDDDDDLPF